MEPYTIQILSQFPDDSKLIDISNKNIYGILDLQNYQQLNVLICSHNYITQILYVPVNLIKLNCSHNQITWIDMYKYYMFDKKFSVQICNFIN